MSIAFKRQFLDFEQPIKELYEQIEENKKLASKNANSEYDSIIGKLEESVLVKRKEITERLTPWQKVQLSRHPDRPYTLEYILKMFTNFVELHGDRNVRDDKAMIGGFAQFGPLLPATAARERFSGRAAWARG